MGHSDPKKYNPKLYIIIKTTYKNRTEKVLVISFWKAVWKIRVPNAVKVFLWRACSNILPTKDNLLKRGVVNEDLCLLCTRERETVLHTLWECPAIEDVWGSSASCIQKTAGKFFTFVKVVEAMVLKCSGEELSIFASTAKMIWARRNSVVFGGMFMHPTRIVHEVKMSLALALSADGENGECVEQVSLKYPQQSIQIFLFKIIKITLSIILTTHFLKH